MYSFSYLEPVCCSREGEFHSLLLYQKKEKKKIRIEYLLELSVKTSIKFSLWEFFFFIIPLFLHTYIWGKERGREGERRGLLLLSHFSRVRLCVTPKMATYQAPPSLGFSRQEHWSGLPFPSPMHEKWKVKVKSLSGVWLFATPWTAAYQAPPPMGFSRQEYWSGVPLPSPILMHIYGI